MISNDWPNDVPEPLRTKILKAQARFKKVMEWNRKQPPPTLEEVQRQFNAVARIRRENGW